MRKTVKVLVIGDADGVESAIRASQCNHCGLACCAGADYLNSQDQLQGTQFDWVMVDAGLLKGDGTELIRSLRAMGFFSSPAQQPAGDRRCGVEWSRDGTLQLKCCMHSPASGIRPVAENGVARPQPGFVFEYHAPAKRTG